jgi:hypothetical protein
MPAGRAVIQRAASAIGAAVPAGPAAAGNSDGVGRYSLWSSGATGIARDAETAARLRPMAKADATSSFMDFFSFLSVSPPRGGCSDANNSPAAAILTSNGGASGASAGANDGDASPSGGDGDANPSDGHARGDPNGPLRA